MGLREDFCIAWWTDFLIRYARNDWWGLGFDFFSGLCKIGICKIVWMIKFENPLQSIEHTRIINYVEPIPVKCRVDLEELSAIWYNRGSYSRDQNRVIAS